MFLSYDNLGKPGPCVKTGGIGVPWIYSIHPRDKSRGFLRDGVNRGVWLPFPKMLNVIIRGRFYWIRNDGGRLMYSIGCRLLNPPF
jgi:hypothetical protein